jgi:tetratricopeptide (TPR) repeat protein
LILNSGGVLREMVRIANECCRICLRLIRRKPSDNIIIDENILDKAINNIRNDFATPLGKIEYEILQTTYQNLKPEDPKQQEFLDLLHGLTSLNNLANLYKSQGKYEVAEPLYQQALKICEQVLGENHPNTLIVKKNLESLPAR